MNPNFFKKFVSSVGATVLLVLTIENASAQTIIIKSGVAFAKVSYSEYESLVTAKAGFTFGVAYNHPISGRLSLQPELNFIQKGPQFNYDLITLSNHTVVNINYLELPILAKATFGRQIKYYLNAGPSIAYGVGRRAKSRERYLYMEETSFKPVKFGDAGPESGYHYVNNRVDFGAQFGAGVLIKNKIMIDVRYGLGLSNLRDKEPGRSNKTQNRVLQFTVGVPIGLK